MAALIRGAGGAPIVAPAIRELPLDPGPDVIELVSRLRRQELDAILFLTRGGVMTLPAATATACSEDELVTALRRVPVGARGPKTASALARLLGEGEGEVVLSDPPHRWPGLLAAMERAHSLGGYTIAVIEHGVPNDALKAALMDRGAHVLPVALYRWVLPEDTAPIVRAIESLLAGVPRAALFTNGAQVDAVMGLAEDRGERAELRDAFQRVVVGAVGPNTKERLEAFGVNADVVPAEATMKDLVRDVAGRVNSRAATQTKRMESER